MCTRARLAGAMRKSVLFSLLLTSQRAPPLLDTGARGSHPLIPASRTVLRRRLNSARRVIILELPGLELPGLLDFLPLRSVETEARVVQRSVTAEPTASSTQRDERHEAFR